MSDSTTLPPLAELLSEAEVAELNAAQRVLRRVVARATDSHWHAGAVEAYKRGMLAGVAELACDAIFDVLNVASSRGLVELTRAQLHEDGRDPEPQS